MRRAQQSTEGEHRHYHGLRFKIAIFIGAFVAVLMVVDALWNTHLQQEQAQKEAQEKAEVLAQEMRAVWDFIDLNQDAVNRNDDGTFRSKTLVCAVAAKSVSSLFTANSEYTIRFTSETPRQKADAPDEFEMEAFAAFDESPGLESYSGVRMDEEGRRVFRYMEPLYVTETCLECHGEPVGELDQYGFAKEGMQVGEIGGAMSIIEPMDVYADGIGASAMQKTLMALIMIGAACMGIYFVVNRLILTPLERLSGAAKRISRGDFDSVPAAIGNKFNGHDELSEFSRDFATMACQLERLYTNLESEVAKQTDEMKILNDLLIQQKQELKQALDKLSEESAYKNEFFAIVSHELRTPLTSILAFARILQQNGKLDESTRASVVEIEANATLLLNLVNNILTISKAEAHKNELLAEPVDFVDLVGFVRASLDPIATNKNIALSAKADENVPISMADWEKLRRIVENLVDNAIKYTHQGGSVRVHVRFEPHGQAGGEGDASPQGFIVIEVADDGMGIDADDLPEIFDLYKQAGQSPNRRYRGTGLGLAVVKELTELHGGTVSVASQRKQGSTFTVSIPHVPVADDDEEDEHGEDFTCR